MIPLCTSVPNYEYVIICVYIYNILCTDTVMYNAPTILYTVHYTLKVWSRYKDHLQLCIFALFSTGISCQHLYRLHHLAGINVLVMGNLTVRGVKMFNQLWPKSYIARCQTQRWGPVLVFQSSTESCSSLISYRKSSWVEWLWSSSRGGWSRNMMVLKSREPNHL